MITKEVNIELAGKTASKVHCKAILVDTENNHNLIFDAVDENDTVYYTDIALNLNDLPFELTAEEIAELQR